MNPTYHSSETGNSGDNNVTRRHLERIDGDRLNASHSEYGRFYGRSGVLSQSNTVYQMARN